MKLSDNIYAKRRRAIQEEVRRERLAREQAEHAKTIARIARESREAMRKGR